MDGVHGAAAARSARADPVCPSCEIPLGPYVDDGWEKILFIRQPFPDNYVPRSFLSSMVRNAGVRPYEYWSIVRASSSLTQQLSAGGLFIAVFSWTLNGFLSPAGLFALNGFLTAVGLAIWLALDPVKQTRANIMVYLQRIVLFCIAVYALSPVLKTLTDAYSDDTIWALSTFFLLANVVLHDYSNASPLPGKFNSPISLNAAIFASVLLASRLPTPLHVCALVLFAILVFALAPVLRHRIHTAAPRALYYSTWGVFGLAAVPLFIMSKFVGLVFIFAVCLITFVSPMWLQAIQEYKFAIRGPWDEAKPVLKS